MKAGSLDRPLLPSLALGAVIGIAEIASAGELRNNLPAWVPNSILDVVFPVLCFLVFPGFISFLARRRYFLWGVVAPVLGGFLYAASDAFTRHIFERSIWVFAYLFNSLQVVANVAIGILISSGLVSLIRYILQRRRDRMIVPETAVPVENADDEGAWSPPPAVK